MDHPGPDVPARLGVDLRRGHVLRHVEDHLQPLRLLAGEGVAAARHREVPPARAVEVLPDHLVHIYVVRDQGHRVPLVDDVLVELVLGALLRQVGDHGGDLQGQIHPGPPLAEGLVRAEIAQVVDGGPPVKAVAPLRQVQGHVPAGHAVQGHPLLGPAAQSHAVQHNGPRAEVPPAGDGAEAALIRLKGLCALIGEDHGVSLRLNGGKGPLLSAGAEGPPAQGRVGQPLGGLRRGEAPLLPQLHLHLTGARQGQHVLLPHEEAVALEILSPHVRKEGLGALQVQLLDHLAAGVHIVGLPQLGGGGLDGPHRLIDHVLPLLIGGEHLGPPGDGHRLLHRVVGGELEQAGGGLRVGHLKAGEVEELRAQLLGHRVHPVHRLVKHLPEQLRQGGARVVLRPLVPPLRGVGPGVGGHLGHDLLPAPGV